MHASNDSIALAPRVLFAHLPFTPDAAITHLTAARGFHAKVNTLQRINAWHPDGNQTGGDGSEGFASVSTRNSSKPTARNLRWKLTSRAGLAQVQHEAAGGSKITGGPKEVGIMDHTLSQRHNTDMRGGGGLGHFKGRGARPSATSDAPIRFMQTGINRRASRGSLEGKRKGNHSSSGWPNATRAAILSSLSSRVSNSSARL